MASPTLPKGGGGSGNSVEIKVTYTIFRSVGWYELVRTICMQQIQVAKLNILFNHGKV